MSCFCVLLIVAVVAVVVFRGIMWIYDTWDTGRQVLRDDDQ